MLAVADILESRPRQENRRVLIVALLLALIAHGSAVTLVNYETDHRTLPPTLSVILRKARVAVSPEVSEPVRAPAATETPVPVTAATTRTVESPGSDDETTQPAPGPSPLLFTRSLDSARQIGRGHQAVQQRSFAVSDLLPVEAPVFASWAPVMAQPVIRQAARVEASDENGDHTVLLDDGFGNASCWQQRGFAGDGNPPLWYRIPADTCGHLR